MNNIYVDELPKSCKGCIYSIYYPNQDVYSCSAKNIDFPVMAGDYYRGGAKLGCCPFKLLSDRLAEERKKVVQEIRQELANKLTYNINDLEHIMVICNKINSALDKFERGE